MEGCRAHPFRLLARSQTEWGPKSGMTGCLPFLQPRRGLKRYKKMVFTVLEKSFYPLCSYCLTAYYTM